MNLERTHSKKLSKQVKTLASHLKSANLMNGPVAKIFQAANELKEAFIKFKGQNNDFDSIEIPLAPSQPLVTVTQA